MSNNTSIQFGDPGSAIDIRHSSDYTGVFLDYSGHYYTPPASMLGLAQLMRAHPVHGTMPKFKANMLLKYFEPNPIIGRRTLLKMAIDYSAMGNAYFQIIKNAAGHVLGIKHLPAINMRRMVKGGHCWLNNDGSFTEFKQGEVFHLYDYDPLQQIYGVPYWFGALQSILLGEDARLFPRRFFKNGGHMGNLITTSGLQPSEDLLIKAALKNQKGIGNFKTMHIGLPKGDVEKVIKVTPIGSTNKIDFSRFMERSDAEVLKAWRVRPELAGMMPENNGGSGDLEKILKMNYNQEVVPYQEEFLIMNEALPSRYHLKFRQATLEDFKIE